MTVNDGSKLLSLLISELSLPFERLYRSEKYLENLVPSLPHPHPKFPAFSDAVEVRYGGPDVGRFCVAKRPIEPGELLAVETPYVWLLDKVCLKRFISHPQPRLSQNP